ncbi:MAG: hypothetical protein P1U32_01710 [Legionellaceae bacterium]|nr:hypothetical protein [Legionellaceae bacterium]
MMKTPEITFLDCSQLMHQAMSLESVGEVRLSDSHLMYLKVDDQYVHQLFSLLPNHHLLRKPDYFDGIFHGGAHISIIYPEEGISIDNSDLNQIHQFEAKDVIQATLDDKTYYVLRVFSSSLTALRAKYSLPPHLCFKGYAIDFHITFGRNA